MMRLFIAFLFLLCSSLVFAQNTSNIPIGTWRTHLPMTSANTIATNNQKIYCASTQSSFTYDLEDGHLSPLSKIDGLKESSVSVIRFHPTKNIGLIGYTSGNIDIIENNIISNFDVILRSNISGSKRINNITIYDDVAFVSCDFGVSIIDLKKREIKETWKNLRQGALPNIVFGCVLTDDKDSVFVATQYGILSAPYNTVNLMDFSNWYKYTAAANAIQDTTVSAVASLNNLMYCSISGKGVFVLNGSSWQNIGLALDPGKVCWNITLSHGKLLVCSENKVYSVNSPVSYTLIPGGGSIYKGARDALYDNNGVLWLADNSAGAFKYDGSLYTYLALNGPINIACFNLYYYNNTILANSGGYNNAFNNQYFAHGFYQFENQDKWVNYNAYSSAFPGTVADNITAYYNPYDDTLYIGSWNYGMVAWKKPNTFKLHTTANSPLKTNYVTGFAGDEAGNMWISTYLSGSVTGSLPTLYSKSKTGTWTPYTLTQSPARNLLEVDVDAAGNKWLRYGTTGGSRGLIVYNEKRPGVKDRYLTEAQGSGALPSSIVSCVEIDKKGIVWIGTNKGLAGFYDVTQAFTADFVKPIYNGFPILFDKSVTCMKVDGGNRKWVGTTEGLWLFNDDFTEPLLFFNTENSPLYSNNIVALEIHAATGELFISTDAGIISYRYTATEAEKGFSNVNVFPNPVRPDYSGYITITGLPDNAVVKVTDIQGKLFYETRSNGGTAVWNMTNYAGTKAETGMYLVFVATDKGDDAYVAKIAIVQ